MDFPARAVSNEYYFEMRLRFAPGISDETVKKVSDIAFEIDAILPVNILTAIPWRNTANYNESYIDLRFRTTIADETACTHDHAHTVKGQCELHGEGKRMTSFGRATSIATDVILELQKTQQFRVIEANMKYADY